MDRSLMLWLLLLSLALHRALAQSSYHVSRSKSVKNNDYNCKQLDTYGKPVSYCRQPGGLAAIADYCSSTPQCKGFDMETYDVGYIKTKADPSVQVDQTGFASFCKTQAGLCFGEYMVYFGYDAASGTDYTCGYKERGIEQKFCRRDGDVIALMDECDRNVAGACGGFVVSLESNGKHGWLKKGSGLSLANAKVARQGFMLFVKTTANPKGHRRSLQQFGAEPDASK